MKNIQQRVDDLEARNRRRPPMLLMRRIVSPASINAPVEVADVGGATQNRQAGETEVQFMNRVRAEAERVVASGDSLIRALIWRL